MADLSPYPLADEAVHMGDHDINRLLREAVERDPLPEDFPQVPVVVLDMPLLPCAMPLQINLQD